MYTEAELRSIGLELPQQRLCSVDTQRFLVSFLRNAGDYTLARRELFDNMSVENVLREASEYCKANPISEEARRRSDLYKADHN